MFSTTGKSFRIWHDLSTVCPQMINILSTGKIGLLWINFLFQDFHGVLQRGVGRQVRGDLFDAVDDGGMIPASQDFSRSEEHTSELQSQR